MGLRLGMGGAVVVRGLRNENRCSLAPPFWQQNYLSIVRKYKDRLGSSMNTRKVLTAPDRVVCHSVTAVHVGSGRGVVQRYAGLVGLELA